LAKETSVIKENHLANPIECNIVSDLCDLFYKHSECKKAENIGIIAPYNVQVNAIKEKFANKRFFEDIEVNTVDQFQGRDKNIIIMSFTNSKRNSEQAKEMEILNDKRRLTVAITRAKNKLILVGCIESLMRFKALSVLIDNLKEKGLIIKLSTSDEIVKY